MEILVTPILNSMFEVMIVVISSIVIMSFIIGRAFGSHYFYFLGITIIALILFCSLYKSNNELREYRYYKYHIGVITCDEYYRQHMYHTMWHIYGESMEEVEEGYEIFDGLKAKEISP